ncbi:MAG: hypothetical protein IJM26_00720, partial [Lachnospiraceae bacterium]|nr:hypothetical protein [Lachnospiraceae bacterium]
TDEQYYIHTKFDMEDLPYIEHIYLGIGDSKKAAYADLIGTTNANAAASVNCNYNSFSGKWIAIGYRRTKDPAGAVRDVMLYSGNNPVASFDVDGYGITTSRSKGKVVTRFSETPMTYRLLQHNLAAGAEVRSLNEGNDGPGLYLYFAKSEGRIAYAQSLETEIFPVRNLAFSYGDISPEFATTEDLARVYGATMYGMREFDPLAYSDPSWEYVLGVEGDSPDKFCLDGSGAFAMGLNYGILPMQKGNFHSGDRRVMAYMDRGRYDQPNVGSVKYVPRSNAILSGAGYYSEESTFGVIRQR